MESDHSDIRRILIDAAVGLRDGLDSAYRECWDTGRDPHRDHLIYDYLGQYKTCRSILADAIQYGRGLTPTAAIEAAEVEIAAESPDAERDVVVFPDGTWSGVDLHEGERMQSAAVALGSYFRGLL